MNITLNFRKQEGVKGSHSFLFRFVLIDKCVCLPASDRRGIMENKQLNVREMAFWVSEGG